MEGTGEHQSWGGNLVHSVGVERELLYVACRWGAGNSVSMFKKRHAFTFKVHSSDNWPLAIAYLHWHIVFFFYGWMMTLGNKMLLVGQSDPRQKLNHGWQGKHGKIWFGSWVEKPLDSLLALLFVGDSFLISFTVMLPSGSISFLQFWTILVSFIKKQKSPRKSYHRFSSCCEHLKAAAPQSWTLGRWSCGSFSCL